MIERAIAGALGFRSDRDAQAMAGSIQIAAETAKWRATGSVLVGGGKPAVPDDVGHQDCG